ncbi:hypothetical protein MLD52_10620 [Puniceicoccaceae bacterium K14]|nr:hypothetical protein [Puniceicoccaceae bacterium K14]
MKKIIFLLLCLPAFAQAALVEVALSKQRITFAAFPGSTIQFFLTPSLVDGDGNIFGSATDATITTFFDPLDLSDPSEFITVSSFTGNVLGTVFATNADLDPLSPLLDSGETFFQSLVIPRDTFNLTFDSNTVALELAFSDTLNPPGFATLSIGGSYFYDDGIVAVNSHASSFFLLMIGMSGLILARLCTKPRASASI